MTEAVVFIPGIGRAPFGELSMTDGAGARLLTALGRNGEDDTSVYEAEAGALLLPQPFGRTDYVRIVSSTPETAPAPVADVYALDLPALLIDPYRNMGTKSRAIKLGWLLFVTGSRLAQVWRRRGKSLVAQLQLLIGTVLYLAMTVAFVGTLALLLAATVSMVDTFISTDLGINGLDQWDNARDWLLVPAAVVTFLLANIPPSWRTQLNANLVTTLVVTNYVASGTTKDAAAGRLGEFIDKLVDMKQYERVHVIAYSVGSLVALDALFSTSARIRSLEKVDSLVTIACPADFIATYWPNYLIDRQKSSAPRWWVNIFEPTDLLGSNFIVGDNYAETIAEAPSSPRKKPLENAGLRFRDDTKQRIPDVNLRYSTHSSPRRQGFIITALKRHRIYWDAFDPYAASAFDVVVQALTVETRTADSASPAVPAAG